MQWKTFLLILQAIILVPLFFFIVYIGFWLTILSGPILLGLLGLGVIYLGLKEWQELKNKDKDSHEPK